MNNENIRFENKLSSKEIKEIIIEIEKVPDITYFSYYEILSFKKIVLYENDNFVGLICYMENNNYVDFKICIIKEEYKKKGYSKLLIKELLNRFDKDILCASKNLVMKKILLSNKFVNISFKDLPLEYKTSQTMMVFNYKRIIEYIKKRKSNKNKFEFFINKHKI